MVKSKHKLRKRGRGTLATIAGLLVLSALLRVGDYVGHAVALEAETPQHSEMSDPKQPSDVQAVLNALQARENRVIEKERKLRLRMAALREADLKIAKRLEELRAAELTLRETLALADNAAEADIAKLTNVYENMKPKEASQLFETMDPSFAAGFLGRMKPAAAAGIMAGLSPEVAYSISVVLVGRNASVPTE
ncbi:MAG: hypothetical protein MK098_03645 [Marinovum sp.]|nr:hypothetical protein [Marinovum sp.]